MAQEVESFSFSPSDRVEAALLVVRTLRLSIWARPPHVPLTRRLLLSARNSPLLFLFLLIHRKAASSQLIRLLSPKAQKPPNTHVKVSLQRKCFPLRNTEWRWWWGGVRGSRVQSPQKIPLAIFNPFCFMRGSVELATVLARIGRARPRFFSTKS